MESLAGPLGTAVRLDVVDRVARGPAGGAEVEAGAEGIVAGNVDGLCYCQPSLLEELAQMYLISSFTDGANGFSAFLAFRLSSFWAKALSETVVFGAKARDALEGVDDPFVGFVPSLSVAAILGGTDRGPVGADLLDESCEAIVAVPLTIRAASDGPGAAAVGNVFDPPACESSAIEQWNHKHTYRMEGCWRDRWPIYLLTSQSAEIPKSGRFSLPDCPEVTSSRFALQSQVTVFPTNARFHVSDGFLDRFRVCVHYREELHHLKSDRDCIFAVHELLVAPARDQCLGQIIVTFGVEIAELLPVHRP